jgi:hypothetical protein
VLSSNAGEFEHLDRVRSRRSGRVVFIEVVLRFEAGLNLPEVNRRIEALTQAMQQEIEHADVSILMTRDAGLNLLGDGAGAANVPVPRVCFPPRMAQRERQADARPRIFRQRQS